jgi:hypothetical protein
MDRSLATLVSGYKSTMDFQSHDIVEELLDSKPVRPAFDLNDQKAPFENTLLKTTGTDVALNANFFSNDDVLQGYEEAKRMLIEGGGSVQHDPFYSKMESDPTYREVMFAKIKRILNKGAIDQIISSANKQ